MNGLKHIRSVVGLSGAALAKRLTVSQPTVFEWEHGKRRVPPEQLKRLSALFDLPEEYFGEITEEQATEIVIMLSQRKKQSEDDTEAAENKQALDALKSSVRRINDIAKAKANDFDSFPAYTDHIGRCAKMYDKFATVMEIYGASALLDRCMTALINAKTGAKSEDTFIAQLALQIETEAAQNKTAAEFFSQDHATDLF